MNKPMIFFNVGWMKRYQGIADDDRPERGGEWVGEHGWDHSMLNFQPNGGMYYGYGQAGESGVRLERLGADPNADVLDGVTVVWVSTPPQRGSVIVGWYTDATLYREYQTPESSLGRTWEGEPVYYNARTLIANGRLLEPEKRAFRVPRGKGGMGQSNVWYADKPEHEPFRKRVLEFIASGGEALPAEPRTWIFQANPKLYNIEAALASVSEMTWLVTAHKEQIAPGDRVYFWRSGAEAGIVGEALVLTAPALMEEDDGEPSQFTLDPNKFKGAQVRVRLQILDSYGPGISRDRLKSDKRLANLSILKFTQGTNFRVSPEEAVAIREIIEQVEAADADDISDNTVPPTETGRVWAYAPGPAARYWEELYRKGILAFGCDELGDLSQHNTVEEFTAALKTAYNLDHRPVNDARACYDLVHTMRPGDRVFVKRGRDQIVGYGVVTGDYEHVSERPYYRNIRTVRWERRGSWPCRPVFAVKTLTDFTPYPDTVEYLKGVIGVASEEEAATVVPELPPYTVQDALENIAFNEPEFRDLLAVWKTKKNLILQGPPGVGKTFIARRLAYALIGHEAPNRVAMVQFHQSYSYEDFIQGFRPNQTGFARQDGIFVRFCKRASLDQNSDYVFIIDEINRSNLSKVFGELLVLIEGDKRGSVHSVALTYANSEEDQFYVPPNVYILGLMNTADRSLALVDYALRRRFAFHSLQPLFNNCVLREYLLGRGGAAAQVDAILHRFSELNQEIANDPNLGHGFAVGHSYVCGPTVSAECYHRAVKTEVIPLLNEYWFDDAAKVSHWTGKLTAPLPED